MREIPAARRNTRAVDSIRAPSPDLPEHNESQSFEMTEITAVAHALRFDP